MFCAPFAPLSDLLTHVGTITVAVNANPSFTTVTATAASNQLVLGSGGTATTITTTPASTRTLTIPDAGQSTASFVLTQTSSAQTIGATTNLQNVGYMDSAGSSTYSTGTIGSAASPSKMILGSSTVWTGAMIGGIPLLFPFHHGWVCCVALPL